MTASARQEILARIRRANIAATPVPIRSHPIPARARGTVDELRDRFIAMAREVSATVDQVASPDDAGNDPIVSSSAVAVTPAFAGIAETGTLLVHSGARNPNQLHFLPETHIAVLPAAAIVGGYEDAWTRLGAQFETPPRSVTLITGPSRSSDIERKLQIGVHGPCRLHIVLYDGKEP